jgi:acyl transferase domain-containing protein
MMSVALPEKELIPLLDSDLAIAAVNSPSLCLVSGPPQGVAQLEEKLKGLGHECLRLNVYVAAHSPMLLPYKDQFTGYFDNIRLNKPQIPYISGLTGDWITGESAVSPLYWARHMTETIRFADGISRLINEMSPVFVQVGPDRGLSLFVNQNPLVTEKNMVVNILRHKKEKEPDYAYLLNGIGQLWLAGFTVHWQAFYAHEIRNRVQLPAYSFERQRFWVTPQKQLPTAAKKANISEWFYIPSKRKPLDFLP